MRESLGAWTNCGISLSATGLLFALANASAQSTPERLHEPLSRAEIASLPDSFAPRFRLAEAYDWSEGKPRAKGNNCASLALNAWGDTTLSGSYKFDADMMGVYAIGHESLCRLATQLIARNERLTVSRPVGESCAAGSWLVIPMHKARENPLDVLSSLTFPFHIVRQMPAPDRRFIHILGPDSPIAWVMTDGPGGRRVATSYADINEFFSSDGYKVCDALCVTEKLAPPHASPPPLPSLAGSWVAAERLARPAAEPDFGRWIGYRAPRCDADTWLLNVELHLGQQALNFLGKWAPRDMTSSRAAALRVTSNIMDPEAAKYAGVNVTFAGRVDVREGRLEFLDVVYDTRGPEAAARRGETVRQHFRPWVVQASSGIRMRVTSVGANHFRALVDWDSPCQQELLFVRPDVPLSGAALR